VASHTADSARKRWGWIVAAAAAVGVCCLIAFTRGVGADYGNLDCHIRDAYCDDAQPSLNALAHGQLHNFFALQPLMGPVTLILRAPFVALSGLDDYQPKLAYDLGVLACLLVLAAVALFVAAAVRERGGPRWQQLLIVLMLVLNPMVFRAIKVGHPEELVVSALCVAVVLALIKERYMLAGALLGAALASKLWAVLIVPAVALSVANVRTLVRMGVVAAAVMVVLYTPMAIGDSGRFTGSFKAANKLGTLPGSVTPVNVWWFVASQKAPFDRAIAYRNGHIVFTHEQGFTIRRSIARITHPIVVVIAAILALLWARSDERRRRPESLLLLFALIFFVRCLLDPGNSSYYHLAVVTTLVSYEGIACRRLPWVSAWLLAWLQAMNWASAHIHSDAGFGAFYLGWALPTVAGLAVWLFRPGVFRARSDATGQRRGGGVSAVGPSTAS
jgi:hypothetical protein